MDEMLLELKSTKSYDIENWMQVKILPSTVGGGVMGSGVVKGSELTIHGPKSLPCPTVIRKAMYTSSPFFFLL